MLPTIRNHWLPALALIAIVLAFSVNGQAAQDDWNKRTLVTVNRPIEVPGKVIPAGKYIFEIVSLQAERNVVRISDQNGKVYATVIGIPTERFEGKSDTVFLYHEAPRGNPEPLRAWFYPNHLKGVEFVYPKKRAVEIAASSSEYVFAEKTEPAPSATVEQLLKEPVVAVTPRGTEVEVAQAPAPKVAAQPQPAPAVAEAETAAAPPPPLPKTGSELPLIGLIGIAAAAAASAIRLYRR